MKRILFIPVGIATAIVLASCSTTAESTKPTSSPKSSDVAPTQKPKQAPEFVPDGSAKDNLAYFSWVVSQTLNGDVATDSVTVSQALSESSFAGSPIQYSFSRTAVGLASDSVSVSVEFAGECLIAQYGKAVPKLEAKVLPALPSGGCLLGTDIQTFG